ncbi:MAG: hypothetical protein K0Q55_1946 [Verrucomicrobia bacterium]|jgi:hypothetical protein|nr:hypothetical protein [Verrucomicrobiota bacterium]
MTTTQANNGQPVLSLTAASTENPVYNGNPVRFDLGATAPLEYGGIMVTAQTSNPQGSPTSISVCFGFCHEEVAAGVGAQRLQARVKTIVCNLGGASGFGDTRDYASGKEPIGGRYLYIWWETGGSGGASDAIDIKAWVQFLK